ncbi:hypothetical protein EMCRGX_G019496 [Ephydatia muelleri]
MDWKPARIKFCHHPRFASYPDQVQNLGFFSLLRDRMPKVKKRKKDFSKHYKRHHIAPYFLESQLERQLERPSIQKADCPYNHSNSSISLNNTVIIPGQLNPRALYNEITQLAILPVGWVMSAMYR